MSKHRHTTLYIPDEDKARLAQMAQELGYIQTRGAGAGELASISAFIRAVARGDLERDSNRSQIVLPDSSQQGESTAEAGKRNNKDGAETPPSAPDLEEQELT
jgi:hypothetical protein